MRSIRILAALAVLAAPLGGALVLDACGVWDGPNTFGANGTPSNACTAALTAAVSAFPSPSASAGNSVFLGGTIAGCPVLGVTLYGSVAAAPVNSSFASWTASVPLTTFESQSPGTCPSGATVVPMQALVLTAAGVNGWVPVDSGCTQLLTDPQCTTPTVSVTSAYPAPASTAPPNVIVAGTVADSACPIAGLTLGDAYPATPVVPGFAAWTATVPLAVFESWASCANGAGVTVPIKVLAPTPAGPSAPSPVTSNTCVMLGGADTACPGASVSATTAYPAPAASGPPIVTLAGTVTAPNCPIAALTILDAYPASQVGGSFAVWTASLPLATLEEQPTCNGGAGYLIRATILTPGPSGLNTAQPVSNAGCVTLAPGVPQPCENLTATVNASYVLGDASSSTVTFGGSVTGGNCLVAGVVLFGAYPAISAVPNFAAWTASVPLSVVKNQPSCPGASPPSGQTSVAVPLEVLVNGNNGLPAADPLNTGCTTIASQ